MFEYHQKIVDQLLAQGGEFSALFHKHRKLDEQIEEANAGIAPVDDLNLHRMKKEKLLLRDHLAEIIKEQKLSQA